ALLQDEGGLVFQRKSEQISQLRASRLHLPGIRVEQGQQRDFFLLSLQLLRHLIGHKSTERIAADAIWPFRLHPANFTDVALGHFWNAGETRALAIQPLRLHCVERLIRSKMPRQVAEADYVASHSMYAEEGGTGTFRLNCDQRRPRGRPPFLPEQFCELLYRGRLQQRRQRKALSE